MASEINEWPAADPAPDWRQRLNRLFGWRRLRTVIVTVLLIWLLLLPIWQSGWAGLLLRLLSIGLLAMLAFGVWEQWPKRLPRWITRWVLQVLAVALSIPPAVLTIYILSTPDVGPPLWQDRERLFGLFLLTAIGILVSPWVALGALVRQKEALARNQALTFALERSELERRALDARLQLLQAQVQPHFLFNTLANVRVLVETTSPRAPAVLDSLIAYLRAAVPRLDRSGASLEDELTLVRAYLDIMQMRMPDRLTFRIEAAPDSLSLYCPPMSVLTLVENAVRHGIDPAEDGGEIVVATQTQDGTCFIQVEDSGLGLRSGTGQTGTGLATLRQRLLLAFDWVAGVKLEERKGGGVRASLHFPARAATS
ncbi:sensor histidine kinase [Indioceanicola profundi]|uniref:sensor histidine kinase n=1 Tax=Indioceanicola profundi TaxID=2220096 RepID=UPI000E6AB5A4|nr:histidine kinase [Indioceanicola profundi]